MIKKIKSSILIMSVLIIVLSSCDIEEDLLLMPAHAGGIAVAYLLKIQPDNTASTQQIYREQSDSGHYVFVDYGLFVETSQKKQVFLTVSDNKEVDDYYLETVNKKSLVIDLSSEDITKSPWSGLSYGEQLVLVNDRLWILSYDLKQLKELDANYEIVHYVENPFYDNQNSIDRFYDMIPNGSNFYILSKNSYTGYNIRVTDLDFNTLNYTSLNSHNLKGSMIPMDNAVAVITVSNAEYDGNSLTYSLTENIIDSDSIESNEIDWIEPEDYLNTDFQMLYSDRDHIIFINNEKIVSFDRDSGLLHTLLNSDLYQGSNHFSELMRKSDNDGNIIIITGDYTDETSDYSDYESLSVYKFNNELTTISHRNYLLKGDYNREILDIKCGLNNELMICYAATIND